VDFTRQHKQTVTYWAPAGTDFQGSATWTAPATLKARWENIASQFQSPTGEILVSKSIAYLGVPVVVGGYLLLGESTVADPTTVHEANEIKQVGGVPDLGAMKQLTTAMM
jgi:hypothetical protein